MKDIRVDEEAAGVRDLVADLDTCKAATGGKWKAKNHGYGYSVTAYGMTIAGVDRITNRVELLSQPDASFIAASRTGWPESILRAIAAETLLRDIAPHAGRLPDDIKARINEITRESDNG